MKPKKIKATRLLSLLLALMTIILAVPLSGISVFAETSGDFKYYVGDNGTASISEYIGSATEVVIPEKIDGYTVTEISAVSFSKFEDLKKVTISNSIISISEYAFDGCYLLESIKVDKNNPVYCDEDGILFNKDKTTIVKYPPAKPGVTYNIPNSVTSIENWAFDACSMLTYITIPNSVTSIGTGAFSGCSALESIIIPNGVNAIKDDTFSHCSSLSNVEIPNSVKGIWNWAFVSCQSLKSITIPDSVVGIGAGALGIKDPRDAKSISQKTGLYDENGYMIGFKIYSYSDTEAETYAKNCGFEFIALDKKVDSATGISVAEKKLNILPDGAQLKAEQLSADNNKIIFDISLVKDGTQVQPNGEVTVKIPVPEGMDATLLKVYREEANGTFTDMNAYFANGYMVFTTDHFSKYIITAEEIVSTLKGDVNGDGTVDAADAVLVQRYDTGMITLNDIQLKAADVNSDGIADAADAVIIMRYDAGLISKL